MENLARPWLPADAIARGVAALPLESATREWAAAWFSSGQNLRLGNPLPNASTATDDDWIWAAGDDAVVRGGETLALDVAALMFGSPDDAAELTAADRAVLTRAVEPCLIDLRRRIADLIGVRTPWRPTASIPDIGGRQWQVSIDRRPLAIIAIADAPIARRIRAQLPPTPVAAPVRRLASALASQEVAVSARIGSGRLTTAELMSIAVGDVIVLDRALDEPADIAIERRPQAMRCAIERDDDVLRLVVQP